MESQPVPTWFEIARKVNELLVQAGAKERFRERIREAAAEWQGRSDEKLKREEARVEAVRATGYPVGSPSVPPDPTKFFCCVRRIPHAKAPGVSSLREAWLPAELSPDLDPDDSLPLPIPKSRAVSRAERYAVLAAVWDALWQGGEKIDPWASQSWADPSGHGVDRSALQGNAFYRYGLVDLIKRAAGDPAAIRSNDPLAEETPVIVGTWVPDVQADLAGGAEPASAGKPAGGGMEAEGVKTISTDCLAREKDVSVASDLREKKWDHVWELIKKHRATKGTGEDQAIANEHNRLCASRISAGKCEEIGAKKVGQIRYEHTHPDRHRKQNHRKRS